MKTFSFPVNKIIKTLNKDFSNAFSTQILLSNSRKCSIDLANIDNDSYCMLVDSIISDYNRISPLGAFDASIIKRELLLK
jgi:hypothetical protein